MSNKNEVFEYLIDQLRQQVNNNQCEDLAHEVQSLKNQLRDASAQLKELHLALVRATGDVEAYKLIRKGDTPGCKHNWVHSKHRTGFFCSNCGARKECEHEWRVVQYSAGVETNKCRLCGEEKEVRYEQSGCRKEGTQECEHEWRVATFYGARVSPTYCRKCGLKK